MLFHAKTKGNVWVWCLVFLGIFVLQWTPAWSAEVQPAPLQDAESSKFPPANMHEQVLNVPGDPTRPVTLQVTVFTPDGPGPFPLAVMNHGATNKKSNEHDEHEPRYRSTYSAYYFLSRGYAVALPMMRGFAGSGGTLEHDGCDFVTMGTRNAQDIEAVIQYMKSQPYVDARHIVVAGQSFGGFNTLAFGTLNDPDVKGLISFAGGVHTTQCESMDDSLENAYSYFGTHTRLPSIWFFGDNDQVFPKPLWQALYSHYVEAGGKAQLVSIGNFMTDSHQLLSYPESMQIWAPRVDAFLASIGMPSKLLYPAYVPSEVPPSSHYAAIDDVNAVPYINDQGQEIYKKYLSRKFPKAFVITPTGSVSSSDGGFDPISRMLEQCSKNGGQNCQVYAVDDQVVWQRPTPEPAPTNFASISDASAVPYINDGGRQGYEIFLTKRRPRAFAIAPNGTWSASWMKPSLSGNDPLANALRSCSEKAHQECKLYAVDNDVVWTK